MPIRESIGFEVSISSRNDGTVEAVYVTFLPDDVAVTKEIVEDELFVDYNSKNQIVGIEILAPVKISALRPYVEPSKQETVLSRITKSAPDFIYN